MQIKLWTIPDGGLTESMKEPTATLTGHTKPVTLLQWNPVADGVLASVGKEPSVRVWDTAKGLATVTLSGFEGLVQDFAWNASGSQLVTSDKNKSAKIFDVRSGSVVTEWKPHAGGKPFKVLFCGDTDMMVTAGFTAQAKREFKLWSIKAGFEAPLTTVDLDQSSGALMPFYDEDTRMLYLTGKGDGNVRYYEFTDEAPFVHPLSEYRSNVSTKGADMLPKRGLNVMGCEVARMLKLTNTVVEPISFIVPRKEQHFQEDIFPETCVLPRNRARAIARARARSPRRATRRWPPSLPPLPPRSYAGVPSCTADAWFAGATVGPKKVTLDPSKGGAVSAPTKVSAAAVAPIRAVAAAAAGGGGGGGGGVVSSPASPPAASPAAAEWEAKCRKAEARVAALEGEVGELKAAAAAAGGGGGGGAGAEEIEALKARVAELEASEAKLKRAVAALSA